MNDIIYLIPTEKKDKYVWCDCPAPEPGMDEDDAVKYIRADIVKERLSRGLVVQRLAGKAVKAALPEIFKCNDE